MYEKTNWVDHVVERQNTYAMTPNTDGTYIIVPEPGQVIQQGTSVSAEKLNNMENGIERAYEILDDKIDKSGGTFSGAVSIAGKATVVGGFDGSGNKLENIADPENPTEAATKKYVDAKHFSVSTTIGILWQGSSAPYTQTISVAGVTADDNPHVTPVFSTDANTAKGQKEAWSAITDGKPGNGTITFRCLDDKPAVAIPIMIEVNR